LIKWILILHLFNGQTVAEKTSLEFETLPQCQSAGTDIVAKGVYQGKNIIKFDCMRADRFYAPGN
jgi:hypothetical protein